MIWNLLIIFMGGGCGAGCRYLLAETIYAYTDKAFPYGILACNVIGSFLIGLAAMLITQKLHLAPALRYAVMVGFLGGFTTFSSFSLDTIQLFQQGAWQRAIFYIISSLILCLLATGLGIILGKQI